MINTQKKSGRIEEYLRRNRESNNFLIKRDLSRIFTGFFMVVLLFGLCFLILQPLFHQFSNSIMGRDDYFDPTIISIPREPSLANYRVVIHVMDYWQSLLRTTGITLLVAVLQISACTLVAYGFARFKFPLKTFWFVCVMATIIVPPHVIMASIFLNFRFFDLFGLMTLITGQPLNLFNSLTGYLVLSVTAMGLRNGLYIFMLRQYFRNMPKELEESAWVDGCGKLRTFAQIMLPDAVPILVSCFLFAFVWQWTDGFYASMFLRDHGVLAQRLSGLGESFRVYYGSIRLDEDGILAPVALVQATISSGVLISIAPIIVIYLFAQRHFVESIGQSGIKM